MNSLSQSVSMADLKCRAKKRVPKFAFEYIEEGCNAGVAIQHNRHMLDSLRLEPHYLETYQAPNLTTHILGREYSAPYGIAPLGLTGLVWPQASVMHAKAARTANIPFVLSTVSTLALEEAAKHAQQNFWFQLYAPSDLGIQDDLLARLKACGCENLVVTLDVPTPSRRLKAIKSGLSVPPKITLSSVIQSTMRPLWSIATLREGLPQFANLTPYMDQQTMSMDDAAEFIRTKLRDVVDEASLQRIRAQWSGKLIVKGVLSVTDAQRAVALGADAIIVSNHGGRQLDAAQSPVQVLPEIVAAVGNQCEVMVDSGVESGVDVARYMALGAKAVFAGRMFLYGVAAHGQAGADHAIELLRLELGQVMSQLHCANPTSLVGHLVK